MYITIFYEFIDSTIFDDIDIEVRKSVTPCKPISEVAKTNIKIWYKEHENVDEIINQLVTKGCVVTDRNPYLTTYVDRNGIKVPRKIYYNNRVILEYTK